MILENVTTGEIKNITEGILDETRPWRKIITTPAATRPTSCKRAASVSLCQYGIDFIGFDSGYRVRIDIFLIWGKPRPTVPYLIGKQIIGASSSCVFVAEDSGFSCNARKRLWHIAIDSRFCDFIREPEDVYGQLVKSLECLTVPGAAAFWLDDAQELLKEKRLVKADVDPTTVLPWPQNATCIYCKYCTEPSNAWLLEMRAKPCTARFNCCMPRSAESRTIGTLWTWAIAPVRREVHSKARAPRRPRLSAKSGCKGLVHCCLPESIDSECSWQVQYFWIML